MKKRSLLLGKCTSQAMGMVLLVIFLVCNEIILPLIFRRECELEPFTLWMIRGLDVVLLGLGLLNFIWHRADVVSRVNFFFIILVIGFFVGEFYFRLIEIPEDKLAIDRLRLRVPDAQLHHRLQSNTVALVGWGAGKPVVYKTNNLGHRDLTVRRVLKKNEYAHRVLILGDSFAECLGINYEDAFVERLRSTLEKENMIIEFLNNGTTSYCPLLEKRSLERFLSNGYQVDGVLLFFDISDIHDQVNSKWYGNWKRYSIEEMNILEAKRELRLSQVLAAKKNFEKYRDIFMLRTVKRFRYTISEFRSRGDVQGKSPYEVMWENERYSWTEQDYWTNSLNWVSKGLELCWENVSAIHDICALNGIHLTIVIYPYPVQLMSKKYPSWYQVEFQKFCDQEQIPLIDLTVHFKNLDNWKKHFIPGDIHWNGRGHEVVAKGLFALREKWLPIYCKKSRDND